MSTITEAIEVLTAGGVIDRLKDEAQDARESERAALLVRLAEAEKAAAVRAEAMATVRPALEKRVADLEAALEAARLELRQQCGGFDIAPHTLDKLRGKLRKLADPRIGQAIKRLRDLDGKARDAFRSREVRHKKLVGGFMTSTESNGLAIADVMASITGVVKEFEALEEAARPDDLDTLLEHKIAPIKLAVQKLNNLA